MKRQFKTVVAVLGVLGLAVHSAMCDSINQTGTSGTTYTGNDDGQGSANLGREINYATIANNASDLFITIALTPTANIETEGNFDYVMDISTGSGGDTSQTTAGNPYTRDIDIDSGFGGMNYWIGHSGQAAPVPPAVPTPASDSTTTPGMALPGRKSKTWGAAGR